MTSINDITDLVQILRDNPEWRDTIRAMIVGEELGKLPGEMAAFIRTTNENFNLVHQQFGKVDQQFEKIDQQFIKIDQRLERLETDVTELKSGLAELRNDTKQGFNQINARLDKGFGANYEHKVTKNISSYARQQLDLRGIQMLRSIRDGLSGELEDILNNAENQRLITSEQSSQLLNVDLILTGRHTDFGINTYLVAELAITIRQDDVTRAANRAEILRNATGSTVMPAVIGARINPEEAEFAREMNVTAVLIPE